MNEKRASFAEGKSSYLNNLAPHIMVNIELLQCQPDFEVSYKGKCLNQNDHEINGGSYIKSGES